MSYHHGKDKLKSERNAIRAAAKSRGGSDTTDRAAREMLALQKQMKDLSHDESANMSATEKLIQQAEELFGMSEFDKAKQVLEKAKMMAKSNEDKSMVFDMLAQILLEEGSDFEGATSLLQESESLTPMSNHERLVTLAQLHEAEESLTYYQQGLNVIEQEMLELGEEHKHEDADTAEIRAELKQVVCNIMVSMAELYVTDLCDEECAESECTRLLETANKLSNTNPEVYRALGNLHMIQGNIAQAVIDSKKAVLLLQALVEAGQPIPDFIPRVELAKQLLELECWQEATELFVMLLDEDENIAELWFYAGIASLSWVGEMASQAGLEGEMHDLTTCAVQYFCQAKRILRSSPDEEMDTTIAEKLRALEESGFDVAGAQSEFKKAAYADGEDVDLNEIDSDDEEEMN